MKYTYADFLRDHSVKEDVKKSENVAPVIAVAPVKEEKKVVKTPVEEKKVIKAPVEEEKVEVAAPEKEEKVETTEAPVMTRRPVKRPATKAEDVKAED